MTKTIKCDTTVGLFATREAAERAVEDLRKAGYRDDQIGLVSKDSSGKVVKRDGSGSADTNAGEGAAIGAAAGAAGGAAAGTALGVGMLAGVIPVIGPVVALGTLATILIGAGAGAAAGAAAGGLTGALIGWGIPEDEAKYYEGRVMAGQHLVTVESRAADDTRAVLTRHGGYDRRTDPASARTTAV
jgi:hypothetical protein